MQEIGKRVRERNNPAAMKLWRKLQNVGSLLLYVHEVVLRRRRTRLLQPLRRPYDAFINSHERA